MPSITAPANLTLDCEDISETTDPGAQITDWLQSYTVSDNCDVEVQVTHDYNATTLDVCVASALTVTWTAVDDAGNSKTTSAQIIVVPDTEAPMITAPEDITLDCSDINETTDPSAHRHGRPLLGMAVVRFG